MKLFKNIDDIQYYLDKFKIVNYKRNDIILHEKEFCDDFFYLIEGKVTLQSNTFQGKKKIFFTIDKDDIINDFDLNFSKFPYEAIAFESCQILQIKQCDLDKLFDECPQLQRNCLALQSHRSRRLYRQLKNTLSINIEKKLAAKLWKFAKDYGQKSDCYTYIDFKINNTYLSDVIGCSRESVSRAIQVLIKMNLLKIENGYYYVKKEELLEYYRQ
ncbi:CRP/FNR family cyclic AMP-dependent transcriptional regulator [Bacilli bacterium PM5-3]|nr:CRP/FNR family cyclic AMP-dependent transcriptional regulator [Bacilli bacterium PM5-3]